MVKERIKLRDNYCKNMEFKGEAPKKRSTFMEKVILEFWYDKHGIKPEDSTIVDYLPKLEDIGKSPNSKRMS